MQPLQIFFNAIQWLRAPDGPSLCQDDPLADPLIAAMTERQLADLPLPRPDFPAAVEGEMELARCA
jgi:hypothetical protein